MRRLASVVLLLGACRRESTEPPAPPIADDDVAAIEDAPPPAVEPPAAEPRPPATIFRIELDRALARGPGWLLGQLAPEPVRQDGRFVGWRIGAVFPDAPELCPELGCDLHPGDVIVSVQGDRLQTPQALTAMIERLDGFQTLTVDRIREGQRGTVVYRIVESSSGGEATAR